MTRAALRIASVYKDARVSAPSHRKLSDSRLLITSEAPAVRAGARHRAEGAGRPQVDVAHSRTRPPDTVGQHWMLTGQNCLVEPLGPRLPWPHYRVCELHHQGHPGA
jgi:hypothetical protein